MLTSKNSIFPASENTENLPGSQALQVQRGAKTPSGANRSSPPYPSPAAKTNSGANVPGKANKKS